MLALRKLARSKTLTPFPILNSSTRNFNLQNPDFDPILSTTKYDELINAAGRERDFAAIRRLLNNRIRDGFFNTTNTFKFITTDLSLLDDLVKSLASVDHGFPRKSAFDTLVARLSKVQRVDEALLVVEIMVKSNYGANANTFHPVLNALTRKDEIVSAWRVMDLMRVYKIQPDLTAYNYILTAHCYNRNLASAAEVLTKIEEEGLGANTRTYDALVLGACRSGKFDGALALLRRMVDDGVPPMYCTHQHVITGMVKSGYYAQAVAFVKGFAGRDEKLDAESFGVLATRLIKHIRVQEAVEVLREMERRGLPMGNHLRDYYHLHTLH